MNPIREVKAPTHTITIYVAGDGRDARRICREYTMAIGLCVTVTDCDYVYTAGCEAGVAVGLLNYPAYPTTEEDLWGKATVLANALMRGLFQSSVLIRGDKETMWLTRRDDKA